MISYLAFEDEIESPVKRNQQRIGNGKIHSLLANYCYQQQIGIS